MPNSIAGKNFYDSSNWSTDTNGHGTHVAGTIVGQGVSNSKYKGVAPGASVKIAKVEDSTSIFNDGGQFKDASDYMNQSPVADIVSMSMGVPSSNCKGTEYSSRVVDDYVFYAGQIYVIAAGNEYDDYGSTSIRYPGCSKNAITIGSVLDNGNDTIDDIASDSSRGPTGDGRKKPDIVAPGSVITSTDNDDNYGYVSMSGTSMATPHVSGLVATLREHYSWLNNASRVKAYLGVRAIPHSGNIDNNGNTYGLGKVDSYVAHWNDNVTDGWVGNSASGTVTNDTYSYIDITATYDTGLLGVVLAWSEPPASAGAGKAVINNLDLWIDKDANEAICNAGEYNSSFADDNKEYKFVNWPGEGTYRIKVCGNAVINSPLPFSLSYMMVRGQLTPPLFITQKVNATTVYINEPFTTNATLDAYAYVASGVYTKVIVPTGVDILSMKTTREDGVLMSYGADSDINLGDIMFNDVDNRTVEWTLKGTTTGLKEIKVYGNSDNAGSISNSIYVNVSLKPAGVLCGSGSECSSTYCQGSQSNAARCCSSSPPSDGYLYCSGAVRQNRDYYCDSNGNAQYEVIASEDCSTKFSTETDGGNVPGTAGACTDYISCSAGSCTSTNYDDICPSTINLTEYYVSSASCPLQTYLCADREVLATGDIADDPTTTGTCTAGSGATCSSGAFTTTSGGSGTDACEGTCGTGTNSCVFREYYAIGSADACSGLDTCTSKTYDADTNSNTCNTCKGANFWNLGGDVSNCCGDDSNENKNSRVCDSGVCNSNSTDVACCTSTNKCIYNGVCYSNGFLGDVDSDSLNEYCISGNWTQPPTSFVDVYTLDMLSSENSKALFEFRINATALNNVTWSLTTGDGTTINSTQNISFGINETVFVLVEHNYTTSDVYNVSAITQSGSLNDYKNITVNVGNLIITHLSVLNSNITERTFEFRILNNMNQNITGLNWTLNTGETIINATSSVNLKPQETAFVFVNYNYTSGGNYIVNASVTNGTSYDDKTLSVTINTSNYDVKLYNLTILNSTGTERTFEFLIENTGSTILGNIGWNMTVTGEGGVNGTQSLNLTVGEIARILVNYNYTTGGLHNVTAKADPSNVISENKENDNEATINND